MRVWCTDCENLISNMPKQEFDDFVAEGNRLVDGIVVFRSRWDMEVCEKEVHNPSWTHIEGDDVEWLYQHNRQSHLLPLVIAYLGTQNDVYLNKFLSLIESWLDNHGSSVEAASGVWRSLDSGIRAENWLLYMQLLGDCIPFKLRQCMDNSLKLHAALLMDTHTAFHSVSNWGAIQDSALFELGVYFDCGEWRDIAIERLEENIQNGVLTDGSHWEQSPMYSGEVLSAYLSVINIMQQHGFNLPSFLFEKTYRMSLAFSEFVKNNGRMYCLGDTDEIDARDLLAFAAAVYKDSYLKGLAGNEGYLRLRLHCSPEQIDSYNSLSETTGRQSSVLPDSGNIFFRTGRWETLFKTGFLGSGHGHSDNLSVIAACDGKDVLTDPGRYTYRDCPERLELKRASNHNSFVIDDVDPNEPLDSWSYKNIAFSMPLRYSFSPAVDYAEGGYLRFDNVLCKRSVFQLLDDGVVIIDSVRIDGKHSLTQNFCLGVGVGGGIDGSQVSLFDTDDGRTLGSIYSLNGGTTIQRLCRVSRHYNEMTESSKIEIRNSFTDKMIAPVFIGFGKALSHFETSAITLVNQKKVVDSSVGIALRLVTDKHEYIIFMCEAELACPVDMLTAFGKQCCGRVNVFVDGAPIRFVF